jgi:hypothetical protein
MISLLLVPSLSSLSLSYLRVFISVRTTRLPLISFSFEEYRSSLSLSVSVDSSRRPPPNRLKFFAAAKSLASPFWPAPACGTLSYTSGRAHPPVPDHAARRGQALRRPPFSEPPASSSARRSASPPLYARSPASLSLEPTAAAVPSREGKPQARLDAPSADEVVDGAPPNCLPAASLAACPPDSLLRRCPPASPSTRWPSCSRLQRVVSYGYTPAPHLQYRRRARTAAAEFVRFFFKPGNMLCRVLSITLGKLSCSVSVRQTSSSFTLLRSRQDTRERLRRVLGKIHTAKDLCRRDVCRVHFAVCQHTAKSLPCSAAPLPCIFQTRQRLNFP